MHFAAVTALLLSGSPTTATRRFSGQVELELPAGLAQKPVGSDRGFLAVMFGDAATDGCIVGVELYGRDAPMRPTTLEGLQELVTTHHAPADQRLVEPVIVPIGKRMFVRLATRTPHSNVLEYVLATLVDDNAVVLSFYALAQPNACDAIQRPVAVSLRSAK